MGHKCAEEKNAAATMNLSAAGNGGGFKEGVL
jgi:hypothetical protein